MLWSITCHFNPCRYSTKLANYRTFRRHLRTPLVTVELVFDGVGELRPGDADRLVTLRGGDVLWQKERLLNVALASLPASCDAVAWVDADVVFLRDDWPAAAAAMLERLPLLQPFSHMVSLPREGSLDEAAVIPPQRVAVARAIAESRCSPAALSENGASMQFAVASGRAWVIRRDVLDRHGLYDAMVVGSGDKMIHLAALGMAERVPSAYSMNDRQAAHYLEWARPFHDAIGGRVGYVEGSVVHLWHGSMTARRYNQRHVDFARFDFDPRADIRIDAGGCWRWNSDKPAMHAFVTDYFAGRNEDGADVGTGRVPQPALRQLQ